jgi:hypothetical protein
MYQAKSNTTKVRVITALMLATLAASAMFAHMGKSPVAVDLAGRVTSMFQQQTDQRSVVNNGSDANGNVDETAPN